METKCGKQLLCLRNAQGKWLGGLKRDSRCLLSKSQGIANVNRDIAMSGTQNPNVVKQKERFPFI